MPYTLKFTEDGKADVLSLPKAIKNWLRKELGKVEDDPLACSSELREPLQQYRSFHCGEYRVIYMVFEDLKAVSIVAVGTHDSDPKYDVYKKFEALAQEGKLAEKFIISLRGFAPKIESR